ncbi:predicted protein [Botrytis cinerea T4]|uniref:Uncharacterized protein n=1 Tax=Botryotinia fuckeliana (strain T4) TaxID=999810 RepID=G2YFA2_BOTF4|nr:predicted protein [Botrytis cinerea T4]
MATIYPSIRTVLAQPEILQPVKENYMATQPGKFKHHIYLKPEELHWNVGE